MPFFWFFVSHISAWLLKLMFQTKALTHYILKENLPKYNPTSMLLILMLLRGSKIERTWEWICLDYTVKVLYMMSFDWMILLYFSFLPLSHSFLPKFSCRMTMLILPSMKIEPLVSFLLLQEFLGCLDWYLVIMGSWMIVKIHFRSCQILLTNDSTSYAVQIKREIFVLVYLASSL